MCDSMCVVGLAPLMYGCHNCVTSVSQHEVRSGRSASQSGQQKPSKCLEKEVASVALSVQEPEGGPAECMFNFSPRHRDVMAGMCLMSINQSQLSHELRKTPKRTIR